MHDEKRVADARELAEPHQPGTDVTGLLDERVGETQLVTEKWPHLDGFREFGNDGRHPAIACERGFGLLESDEILNQVGELLEGHTDLQPFRHERDGAAALCLNVAGGDPSNLTVRTYQLDPVGRGLLENAVMLVASLCLHDRRPVADGD